MDISRLVLVLVKIGTRLETLDLREFSFEDPEEQKEFLFLNVPDIFFRLYLTVADYIAFLLPYTPAASLIVLNE